MIRDAMHRLRHRHRPSAVPYHMFDAEHALQEATSARKLERIYHKGQDKIWDGKEVLAELVARHGGVHLPPERIEPLRRLFAVIFWGELAAWKVSARLALELEPLEAKLAATSQAHDEARHFYVLHDYLKLIGYTPAPLPGPAARILQEILTADTLAKQLMGMQLMVEPIALTLFQMVREAEVEPVLAELLRYYERDEARHVGLGVHLLPELFRKMGRRETLDQWAFQLRLIRWEIEGMVELEEDFRALGLSPREVMRLGTGKQLRAAELLSEAMGTPLPTAEVFTRLAEAQLEWRFPLDGAHNDPLSRAGRAARALLVGPEEERPKVALAA